MKKSNLKQLANKALTTKQQKNTKGGAIDASNLGIIDITNLDSINW